MSEKPVIARKQGKAGRLTLNRPKALHSLNSEMIALMTDALVDWSDDPDVELVVLDHAEGTRGFCAGGDVRLLAESGAKDGVEAREFFAAEYRLNTLIKEYEKPVVAIQDGVTMGGGVGISVHGDYRVATPNTMFAMPESGIGLFPDVGGGWFLPRLPGEMGLWLALTGERLKGKDVLAIGVATHFAEEPEGLADQLCENGVAALDGMETTADPSFVEHIPEVDACFAKGSVEEIIDCLEAGSDWAQKQAQSLKTKAPLTLKIAYRQLREGGELKDFRENMRMEYRIASRLVLTKSFHEGVRAVLIDKDNEPDWVPGKLEEVSPIILDSFFEPMGEDELKFIGETS